MIDVIREIGVADRLGGLYASVTMPPFGWRELTAQCRSCTQRHRELSITSSRYGIRFKREELIKKGACQFSCNAGDVVLAIPFSVLFRVADPGHLFHEIAAIWDDQMISADPFHVQDFSGFSSIRPLDMTSYSRSTYEQYPPLRLSHAPMQPVCRYCGEPVEKEGNVHAGGCGNVG